MNQKGQKLTERIWVSEGALFVCVRKRLRDWLVLLDFKLGIGVLVLAFDLSGAAQTLRVAVAAAPAVVRLGVLVELMLELELIKEKGSGLSGLARWEWTNGLGPEGVGRLHGWDRDRSDSPTRVVEERLALGRETLEARVD